MAANTFGKLSSCGKKIQTYKKKLFFYRCRIIFRLFVFLSVPLIFLFFFKSVFSIKEVHVDSDIPFYSKADFVAASNLKINSNILLCNTEKIKNNIEKKLPFADVVSVRKKLPNKIVIDAKRLDGFAVFKSDSGYIITNENLKVLEIVNEQPKNLMFISGVTLDVQNPGEIINLNNKIQQQFLLNLLKTLRNNAVKDDIKLIDAENIDNININFEDRIFVKLGKNKNLEKKIEAMLYILREKIKNNEHGILDISSFPENSKVYFVPEKTENNNKT